MKKIHLYCLPFAGGSKYSYREYETMAPAFLQIICLEYPGRGQRIKDPFIADLHAIVDDLYQQIKPTLDKNEYGIYGHSMGGIIGYLLTRKIIDKGHRPPLHLFVTGACAPSAPGRGKKKYHLLNKPQFLEEVKKLKGLPDEILDNEDTLDFFEPILRADFRASETYLHHPREPLEIPFTVITGTEEDIETEDILLWQRETNLPVDFKKMPGEHFFIFRHVKTIIHIISVKLFSYSKHIIYE
ncbi:MAG TPA: thioesterase domain-containing protein [Puia sp.]|nr:thioesterase domain-containing protein [Puia sp.]